MKSIVNIENVRFAFEGTAFQLSIDELAIEPGESVAFIGPSGSGKTTLLSLMAGILLPTSGDIVVNGIDVTALSDSSRRAFRVQHVGLVFQEFELLEHLSVFDNVVLPYRITGSLAFARDIVDTARELARFVGIDDKLKRYVGCLSQGERQRVAVCRALVTRPELVFADEPTGNLDPDNKWKVMDMLLEDVQRRGATLITVTHDHDVLDRFDRVIDFAAFHDRAPKERR